MAAQGDTNQKLLEIAILLDKETLTVVDARDVLNKPRIFTDANSVNEFFFYDTEKRGLLYKKNSSTSH